MSSLVLELQRAAMDPDHKVSDLLRKALVVASKLQIRDFKKWCEHELAGYEKVKTPSYRNVQGQLKAWNSYRGWIPVMTLANPELMETLSQREIGSSVGELEQLHQKSQSDEGTLQVPLPPELLIKVFGKEEAFRLGLVPILLVDRTQIYGILEAVRNAVLKWSLELEQKGILGDSMTFSQDEFIKASHITYNIQNFTGILGDVTSSAVQVGDYNNISGELERLGITEEERNELKDILETLPSASPTQKSSLRKRGLDWVTRHASTIGTLSETIRGWFEVIS